MENKIDKQKIFCKLCKVIQPLSNFGITTTTVKGKSYKYIKSSCKKCVSKVATQQEKDRRKANPEEAKKIAQQKYIKQVESGWINDYRKKYHSENKESIKEYRKRLAILNPQFAEIIKIRSKLCHFLDGSMKSRPFENLIGCDLPALKKYLESKFANGMNWDNRSLWHVDHINPLSSYNLLNEDELKQSCHFTNLQPLWASDNIRKGGYRRNFSNAHYKQ